MLEKIKNNAFEFTKRLTDMRFLGQVVFVIIVVLVSWSTSKAIQTNYELQKRVSALQQKTDVQKLKNENLKIRNQYLGTDEFLELAARRQLGKGAPGEKLVIIPKVTAMSYTVPSTVKTNDQLQQQAEGKKPFYQRNLESWGRFFLRR